MSTTLMRAYESFFTPIDVEGTVDGRALSVSLSKSYSQVFFAKESSSQPRIFFMADLPETNNLIVKIFTVTTTGSGNSTSYLPDVELVSFSGQLNYLNSPDNEAEPFSEALWYYIDTEITLNQGSYYAIVFSSNETVETLSPKIYFSKTYRNEIFPIFLAKTSTEDWSNELVPTSSSGSLRTGCFVLGFTGKEVDSVSDFDSGSVSLGGTGASARRGYSTFLYVEKESSITNDISVQFFQEPPTNSANGTSEETDQSMMRFYYFKEGTLPLSGKAFYNKTINASPTLDENASFIVFVQPDRLPPIPKPYLPDAYMDTEYKKIGVVSIYDGYEEDKHRIEYERGIIDDTSNRSSLEYWAHFAEMKYSDVDDDGNRVPTTSSNPSYIDFSLEKPGDEVEILDYVTIPSTSDQDRFIRGYNNITKIGKYYIGFPKYQTNDTSWYTSVPYYSGSSPKMTFKGIISSVDSPNDWSFIDIEVTSDYDPYDVTNTDERGVYTNVAVLGNPNTSYTNRYIGIHETTVAQTLEGDSLFALMQVFPKHLDEYTTGENDVIRPCRPFCNLIVSFSDFSQDTAPSTVNFRVVRIENEDPYDGRFEARVIDSSSLGVSPDFASDNKRVYPNIDSDYKAAKFIGNSIGENGYLYFTILNNRRNSNSYNGDARYGSPDAISKFGIWKLNISTIANSLDFRTSLVKASLVQTSAFTRQMHARSSATRIVEEWDGLPYLLGDLIKYDGHVYRCASGGVQPVLEDAYSAGDLVWIGILGGLDGRGFDPSLEHEYEITSILSVYDTLYFGTATALTQTSAENSTQTYFAHNGVASNTYQFGDYVSSGGNTYMCLQEHKPTAVFATDYANNYWLISTAFKPSMAEVYKTNNLLTFDEVIDGNISQDWLVGYTECAVDETSVSGSLVSFKAPDRVVYMELVEKILHVWTSSSGKYDGLSDYRTPFHIAHDISFGRTKVLRKFPIWFTYEEDVYFDLDDNGGSEVDASAALVFPYEKGTIFNDDGTPTGTRYVAIRKLITADGPALSDLITSGLVRTRFLPEFIESNQFYTRSFKISKFTSGVTIGNYVYLSGVDEENVTALISNYDYFDHGIRWIMYDRRTLNNAFEFYDDTSYKIDDNADDFISSPTTPVNQWEGDGDRGLVVAPYKSMEFLGSKWGVYHHKTLSKYDFFESSTLLRDYPALNIGRENPRIGKYCWMVGGSPDLLGSQAPQVGGTIENDLYNRNPRLVSQGGICYLVSDNDNRGAQVYKTYGYKQHPKDWGLTRVFAGSSAGVSTSETTINAEGSRIGINTYNFDIDKPSYERALPGFSTLEEVNTFKVDISQAGRVTFLTEMKIEKERVTTSSLETNLIDSNIPKRHITRLTVGDKLPQNISMMYNLRETAFSPVEIKNVEDLEVGEINLPDLLVDPTQTTLTLKHAETLEELFTDPESITIPIAQERIVDVGLFEKIMLFSKSLPTDLQSNFFRLESTKLIKDNAFPLVSYDYVTYDTVKSIKSPFAEVIVKGLRFTDVDFSGAKETSLTTDKDIVVSGIYHRNVQSQGSLANVENILTENINGGVYLSSVGYIYVIFPKPIYISKIGFNAYYDGTDYNADDLSSFNFSIIPIFEKQIYSRDLYSDSDWVSIGDVIFDSDRDETVSLSGLSVYTKAIRIKVSSGLILRLNNLKFKTFIQDVDNTFTTTGSVYNPELIIVDDLKGIIEGYTTNSSAFASFKGANSSVTMNLGEEIPINRISMNITNSENTRTVRVEVTDSTDTWETIYVGNILNYEYALVRWIPRSKNESRIVDVRILDSEEANSEFLSEEGFSSDLIEFILNNHSSNFSTNFSQNQLSRHSFRPNAFGDKTLTIFGSSSDSIVTDYDGNISVNTQMDEDGYFSDNITMGLGLIERPLNIDFPLKNIQKVRVTVLNSGTNTIRMNGFKVYTPLVDSDGDHITPQSLVNWNIRLSSFVI